MSIVSTAEMCMRWSVDAKSWSSKNIDDVYMKGLEERYLLGQKQSANFRGYPLYQAIERRLNNS